MLDYLLLRPREFRLWQHNGPETLQYLSEGEGNAIKKYAQTVFGEPFDEESLVGEARLCAGEFLGNSLVSRVERY